MSNLLFEHDYCHCNNEQCPKKDMCYRYLLHRWHKEHPKANMWCSYAGFQPDENGKCEDFITKEDYL